MAASRKCRIVKRVALTIAAAVLLLVWYVGSWLIVSRATYDGIITNPTLAFLPEIFHPLRYYSGLDLPGSRQLHDLWYEVNPPVVLPSGIAIAKPGAWYFSPPDPPQRHGVRTISD